MASLALSSEREESVIATPEDSAVNAPEHEFAVELETYGMRKSELLECWEGKYVLIKGAIVLGYYDTKLGAIAAGHEQIGPRSFLVKKIERVEKPVRILLPGG